MYLLLHFNSLNCLFAHSPCFASLVVALVNAVILHKADEMQCMWLEFHTRNTWGVTAAVVGIAGWNFLA